MEPAVFTRGEFTFVEPMSGAKPHRFPPPVGLRRPMYTIHSEVATLPLSYRDRGVREVSFKIAFDPEFIDRVRFLRDLGMASHELIDVAGVKVRPVDVVNKVAMSQPPARQVGKLKQYEVVRAIVKGTGQGQEGHLGGRPPHPRHARPGASASTSTPARRRPSPRRCSRPARSPSPARCRPRWRCPASRSSSGWRAAR